MRFCPAAHHSSWLSSPLLRRLGQSLVPSRRTGSPSNTDPLSMYDDNRNGNGRITCAEARAHGIAPVRSDHPAYQHMRDGDGDGIVCE